MKKFKNLKQTLAFVARAIGDKMGVQVTFGGGNAFTNGKIINIPNLPEDSEKAAILARGYIDHEAGHIRMTDFEAKGSTPLEHALCNVIEDIRIERGMGQRFPGCKTNLGELAELLAKDGKFSPPEEGEILPVQAFIGWLLAKLRLEELGQQGLQPVLDDCQEVLEETFGDLTPHLEKLADEARVANSTEDSLNASRKILQTLQDWITNPPPPPPQQSENGSDSDDSEQDDDSQESTSCPGGGDGEDQEDKEDQSASGESGSGQDGSDDDSGDGSDSGSDSSDGEDAGNGKSSGSDSDDGDSADNSGSGSKDAGDDSGDEQDSSEESDGEKGGQNGGKGAASEQDVSEIIEKILNASEEDLNGFDIGEMVAEALSEVSEDAEEDGMITLPETEDAKPGHVDLGEVRQATAQLRARLAGLVQASRHKTSHPRRTGRRVDRKALSRIARCDSRIFTSREEKADVNTAVMVLLDRSGSMHGSKIEVARQSVLASALAMEAIDGVSVAAAAFPGVASWDGVVSLTNFGQSPRRTAHKYGLGSSGGTPLTEALYWAAYQLHSRPEPRKILIVATDGDPNDGSTTSVAIKRLEDSGVEVLGLGILYGGVQRYFSEHQTIKSLPELPQALFGMLQKKLTRAA